MKRGPRRFQTGFSLIELLIVIALITIISAIAFRGSNTIAPERLKSASHQLCADLQNQKQKALMTSTVDTSRGFGIRFQGNGSYCMFEFNDADNDYTYKADNSEEKDRKQQKFPNSVATTIVPAENVVVFDKRGIPRATDWSYVSSRTYVLTLRGAETRCVAIDGATVREGFWNGTICK